MCNLINPDHKLILISKYKGNIIKISSLSLCEFSINSSLQATRTSKTCK